VVRRARPADRAVSVMRMDQEPDFGDPCALVPPTREQEEGDAWEYWHQRAHDLDAERFRLHGQLASLHYALREIEQTTFDGNAREIARKALAEFQSGTQA
jgi:hypothetical protein